MKRPQASQRGWYVVSSVLASLEPSSAYWSEYVKSPTRITTCTAEPLTHISETSPQHCLRHSISSSGAQACLQQDAESTPLIKRLTGGSLAIRCSTVLDELCVWPRSPMMPILWGKASGETAGGLVNCSWVLCVPAGSPHLQAASLLSREVILRKALHRKHRSWVVQCTAKQRPPAAAS